jgi:signal transduction histidine kinase
VTDVRRPDEQSPVVGQETTRELPAVVGAIVHDLRTPLFALSGEVELALRRERSPSEYREALARMGEQVAELVSLTADLAFLIDPSAHHLADRAASLDAVLAAVGHRFESSPPPDLTIDRTSDGVLVLGDESFLARALTLLVERALRWRRTGARVRLRVAERHGSSIDLQLDAAHPGLLPGTWDPLVSTLPAADPAARSGRLALQTAARIVWESRGSIDPVPGDATDAIRIGFRCA